MKVNEGSLSQNKLPLKSCYILEKEKTQFNIHEDFRLRYFASLQGAFNNYIDRRGWVGGQVNVYAHKIKDHCLFTSFVYKG